MFDDARRAPAGTRLECDVAVVGTGAAGAAVACELIGSGLRVLVLESGGERLERATQVLYEGEVDNPQHGSLTHYRRRLFGGTTTVWGGRVSPFDPIDFEARDWVPHSGWPVTRAELDPFYARAHAYTHAGDFTYESATALPAGELIPGLASEVVRQDRFWRFSLPTDFGKTNRARLRAAENVTVLFHANALQLATAPDGRVETLRCASLEKNEFTVAARWVVLAAGGLETTRLLLLSDIGTQHDALGRYYASHVAGDLGEVQFTPTDRAVVWDYERGRDGVYCKRHLRTSEEAQRAHRLMNFRAILSHPPFHDPGHRHGVLSAVYLVKRFLTHQIPPEFSRELASRRYERVPEHVRNVLLGAPALARFGWHWLWQRILATRKFPSVALRSASNTYTLHFDAEQAPNPASRVLLADKCDAFGLRQLRVEWRGSAMDVESVAASYRLLRAEFERTGVGRCLLEPERVVEVVRSRVGVGSHHTGTTRMSDDPRRGVVDRDCRVHGAPNLFIAAPSVFCTPSFANPVLTTTALAIRVADCVKAAAG